MGAIELAAALIGSGILSSAVTAWAARRTSLESNLHASEVEFRKSLLERIEQLESHDAAKTERLAAQSLRIAELEADKRNLEAKLALLEARLTAR